ncbi:MAG: glycosyltransferase [Deltaproteobacteria bacterium]|nr:glycosyltransferase [Deltaproteobacteria bacterium]
MSESTPSPVSFSLAVLVGDGWEANLRCLLALALNSNGVRRETIVVDDGTTDDTRLALPRLDGIRLVRNERPVGFARAAAQAAEAAKGDVLLLLDRDAEPKAGWLPPLARLFEDPAVAAACPSEASGLGGAYLAVRMADLREAGGWDEKDEAPADALLARLQARGRKVEVVAQTAMVMHAPAAAAPRPRLSVVVPACDAASTLTPCLESIKRSLRPDDEIVIADGGSRDDTLRSAYAFASQNPRQVRVVSARTQSAAAAAHEGLQAASNEVALLLHPTVSAPEGFVDGILDLLAKNPATQALGIEVPKTGVCVAGPSALLRDLDAQTFFQADGVALAEAVSRAGARLAFVPAGG